MLATELFESQSICPVCGCTPCNCTHIVKEDEQLDEASYRDVIRELLDRFYKDVGLPPIQGNHLGILDIKSPGTRVWTRGDGVRHRDPGAIVPSYWSDEPKKGAVVVQKFWQWLQKQPGVRPLGQISGEFGNSKFSDMVGYKGLYFAGGQRGVEFGSLSRFKNPRSVWRHKAPEVKEDTDGTKQVFLKVNAINTGMPKGWHRVRRIELDPQRNQYYVETKPGYGIYCGVENRQTYSLRNGEGMAITVRQADTIMNGQLGVAEDNGWREASAKSNLQPGVPIMVWLGPRNQNPPRDDKQYWEKGEVMDSPEWIDGAWRVLIKTASRGQWPINPERVFVLKKSVEEDLKDPKDNPCWKGYHPVGTKKKAGKKVPNCVPEGTDIVPAANPEDTVSLDIPLLIRLLEYSREDAKTDMDLHNVAERLITLSAGGKTLSMNDYDTIIPGSSD